MILPTSLKYSDNSLYIVYSTINIDEFNKNKYYDDCHHEEANIYTNDSKIDAYPAFFIFHKSRCGSLLLTEMITQKQDMIVFSEPHIINQCLSLDIEHKLKVKLLLTIITAFCNECNKFNKEAVFKFSSYCLQYIDMFNIFQTTKKIYITHDTLEVLKSNLINPTDEIRNNRFQLVNKFPDFNPSSHFLAYIFKMDELGNKCDYVINYNDIIKDDFINTFNNIFNINHMKNITI
jgi:hypothetical protein